MYAIWNLTNTCPWHCKFCCVSAKWGPIANRELSLGQVANDELCLESKMEILRQLIGCGIEIDFSGGDPLYFEDDYSVISRAVEKVPKGMIHVSTTGAAFSNRKLEILKRVGNMELTLDSLDDMDNPYRPNGYSSLSMRALKKLVSAGVNCSAVTILYPLTMTQDNLASLHKWLCENDIAQWSILKFCTAGRGVGQKELVASNEEYLATMRFIEGLGGSVLVAFQHSLKVLAGQYVCHAAHGSIGILPDGTVVSCAWALDRDGRPLDGFRLGKLPEEDLVDVLKRALASDAYKCRPTTCRIIEHFKLGGSEV